MKNYKIIKVDRPITDHEIDQYKNFEAILNVYQKNTRLKWIIGAGLFLIVLAGSYFLVNMYYYDSGIDTPNPSIEKAVKQPDLPNYQIDSVKDDFAENKPLNKNNDESLKSVPKPKKEKESITQPANDAKDLVFAQAKPGEGFDQLYRYFNENLQLPDTFAVKEENVLVVAECFINKDGNAEEIEITKGAYQVLNQEAIRLIRSMPAWDPAIIEGEKVRSRVTMPIYFKINQQEP